MPEVTENYVHIPIREAGLFIDGSFRTIEISKKDGIKAIIGKLKTDPNGGIKIQKYLFDKSKWDMESATAWVNDHKSMTEILMGDNEIIDFHEEQLKMEKLKKLYNVECKDFNDIEKSFTATASTEDVDREGDILTLDGWKLKNYKKNPVILWQHDASLMPIAKADDVWTEGGKLKFKPVFAPPEVNPFASQVFNAYKKGFLTSFSVRFDPIEWEDIVDKANPSMRTGRKYKKHELLEISAVNIPANPNATKSPELYEFVVKSYLYENKSKIDLVLREIYTEEDEKLKEKINLLLKLKDQQKEISELKKRDEIEQYVDSEIEKLKLEIDEFNKRKVLINELKELQAGITSLLK